MKTITKHLKRTKTLCENNRKQQLTSTLYWVKFVSYLLLNEAVIILYILCFSVLCIIQFLLRKKETTFFLSSLHSQYLPFSFLFSIFFHFAFCLFTNHYSFNISDLLSGKVCQEAFTVCHINSLVPECNGLVKPPSHIHLQSFPKQFYSISDEGDTHRDHQDPFL